MLDRSALRSSSLQKNLSTIQKTTKFVYFNRLQNVHFPAEHGLGQVAAGDFGQVAGSSEPVHCYTNYQIRIEMEAEKPAEVSDATTNVAGDPSGIISFSTKNRFGEGSKNRR